MLLEPAFHDIERDCRLVLPPCDHRHVVQILQQLLLYSASGRITAVGLPFFTTYSAFGFIVFIGGK